MRALQLGPSNLESKSYSASGLCNLRLIVKAIWLRYKAWSGARFSFRLCSWLNASVVLAANGTQAGMRASAFASILGKTPNWCRPLKTRWVSLEGLPYRLLKIYEPCRCFHKQPSKEVERKKVWKQQVSLRTCFRRREATILR